MQSTYEKQAGKPVAISKSKDKDFLVWKVEYGFSCLVFPSYEDAMISVMKDLQR